ncbi:MAG: lipoprotein-releasing ABC transporter permease subunit [Nitrospinaceae bacterium]|nr:lipoprotein-releasing ABC transporter permease subunit [Nitrospinaceae bacterium]MBT3434898.1 lipoprotein-releasing ABC transporter permease subunit [Nitrospinaceae bacterium]MBT3819770.1 lipoprotein-releasing ABC transporter permease subunit [Nitrospinaceae bacterium]MBT4094349.1 lipoprotein-releasing ABC transporter permease subunit [Nitrospinaceae bacterium]MBT4429480.1 lipoprotein-releasing ABC transporter permease subunit [Nitrospinaceae bacterium]
MKIPVELFIGMRHLRSKKKNAFVSITTWISVLGISLGVATLIVVVGVMSGFERELRSKILGTQSHVVVVESGEASMKKWDDVLKLVRKDSEVVAASPFVFGQAMLSSNGSVTGAVVRGIDPVREKDVTNLAAYMRAGSLDSLSAEGGMPGVILGSELASSLGLQLGMEVTIISPVGAITPMGVLPKSKTFKTTGIFRSGFYQYDSGMALIDMKVSQDFFGLGAGVTGVHMKVKEIFGAERVSRRLQKDLLYPYWVRSWQLMNRNLFSALKTEKTTMTILLLLVIVVAAFNIIGSLIMVVMEKGREIAILKSMGATRGVILRIFFIQGAVMGLAGAVLGTIGGLVLGWNLGVVESFLENYFGLDILPPSVYNISRLPVHMTVSDVTLMALGAFLISLLATVYPAWRASRVDPVEVLRYG